MKRDPFYQQLIHGLNQPLDPDLFERCASDILRIDWPTLVPVRGGGDAGMDGAIADAEGTAFPFICTTGADVIGNLTRSLASYIKNGGERRRALLATSQELTPRKRQNLENRAKEKGFVLLQIYSQAAIADRLYRNPAWCRELLNLTGTPPALSLIPPTSRPLLDVSLVGREEDAKWLQDQQTDCLLIGQPGCGKTFLLHDFAKAGGGLFVVSEDRNEIAACLRAQQPPTLILDDTHVHLDFLKRLRQLRQETGLSFKIVACCWPGQQDAVREILNLPASQIHTLELLTRDQILRIIKSTGIHGPDELLRELVDQSEGRPGLAVTLAHLCLQGAVREVTLGDALSRSIRATFEPLVGNESTALLAGFAVGGRSGMSIAAVADTFGLPLTAVHRDVSSLAAGGVIQQLSDDRLAVRPAGLRHALVRDLFFCGAMSLPIGRFLSQVPSTSDAAYTLIGARGRGAEVPDDLLVPLIDALNEKRLWNEYAFLGERETDYVLRTAQVPITHFAEAALYYRPKAAILRLLETAATEAHNNSSLEIIQKWVQEAEPGKGKAIESRRLVLQSVHDWLAEKEVQTSHEASKRHAGVAAQAIAFALSPQFERTSLDPGQGNTLTLARGILSVAEARAMSGLWHATLPTISQVPPAHWKAIVEAIESWVYPERHGESSEPAQVMHDLARQMIKDLAPQLSQYPGLLTLLKQQAEHLNLRLDVSIDNDFATLFPSRSFEDWREEEIEHLRGVRTLAEQWKLLDPAVSASKIRQLEEEANIAGLTWPRLIPQFCDELASQVDHPAQWANAFSGIGLAGHFTWPFLNKAVKTRQGNWEILLHNFLEDPSQRGAALVAVLMLDDPPLHLLDQALKLAGNYTQQIETCCLRNEVPLSTVQCLLRDEQATVATAAAIGVWTANPRGVVQEKLLSDWNQAIVRTRDNDYWIGKILSADPLLTEAWLSARLTEEHDHYFRLCDASKSAIVTLDETAKLRLLPSVPDCFGVDDLITWLVGKSCIMYASLLQIPHLKPHHLVPLESAGENTGPMIVQALNAGYDVADIAVALHPTSWSWAGEESLMWKQWVDRFDKLAEHTDERIKSVAVKAKEMATSNQKRAEAREHSEAVYGRNR